jgi:hypothetical protein
MPTHACYQQGAHRGLAGALARSLLTALTIVLVVMIFGLAPLHAAALIET